MFLYPVHAWWAWVLFAFSWLLADQSIIYRQLSKAQSILRFAVNIALNLAMVLLISMDLVWWLWLPFITLWFIADHFTIRKPGGKLK